MYLIIIDLTESKVTVVNIKTITDNEKTFNVDNYINTNYNDKVILHKLVENVEINI